MNKIKLFNLQKVQKLDTSKKYQLPFFGGYAQIKLFAFSLKDCLLLIDGSSYILQTHKHKCIALYCIGVKYAVQRFAEVHFLYQEFYITSTVGLNGLVCVIYADNFYSNHKQFVGKNDLFYLI